MYINTYLDKLEINNGHQVLVCKKKPSMYICVSVQFDNHSYSDVNPVRVKNLLQISIFKFEFLSPKLISLAILLLDSDLEMQPNPVKKAPKMATVQQFSFTLWPADVLGLRGFVHTGKLWGNIHFCTHQLLYNVIFFLIVCSQVNGRWG